jgi:hypothetical protein
MIKAYQLLNEYKPWRLRTSVTDSDGVAFMQKGASNNDWMADKMCHACNKKGHIASVCRDKKDSEKDETASKQDESSNTKKKNTKEKKKKKKAAKQFVQEEDEDKSDDDEDDDHVGEGFTQFGFCSIDSKKLNLSNMLLLDNQSTVDLFYNRKLVTSVYSVNSSMTFRGNGRAIMTCKKANMKGYGEVWFDHRATTNVLSFKNVIRKYTVTHDCKNVRTFTVHKPDGCDMHFCMHEDVLHYYDTQNREVSMVNAVAENKSDYIHHSVHYVMTPLSMKTGTKRFGDRGVA